MAYPVTRVFFHYAVCQGPSACFLLLAYSSTVFLYSIIRIRPTLFGVYYLPDWPVASTTFEDLTQCRVVGGETSFDFGSDSPVRQLHSEFGGRPSVHAWKCHFLLIIILLLRFYLTHVSVSWDLLIPFFFWSERRFQSPHHIYRGDKGRQWTYEDVMEESVFHLPWSLRVRVQPWPLYTEPQVSRIWVQIEVGSKKDGPRTKESLSGIRTSFGKISFFLWRF